MAKEIKEVYDNALNDADKTVLTCPSFKIIELISVDVHYVSTATVRKLLM